VRKTFSDLSECREFALLVQARPPRLVHGCLLLASLLLGAAVTWSAQTQADLVVRAPGRVRPIEAPTKVIYTPRGEGAATGLGGRVAEVYAKPGDAVRAGDVLARRDTERLDNEIARRKRAIAAGEEELAKLKHLEKLQGGQLLAAQAKAKEEIAQAEAEVAEARKRQATEVRQAEAEVAGAADELARTRRLVAARAAAQEALTKAETAHRVAKTKLERARLAADDGKVRVARRALAVLQREGETKREELVARQVQKRGETEAARLELANLELERREAVLVAPIDGVVTSGELRPGDALEPGKAVMEIAGRGGYRFEALVPSEEMADVRVGMPARVRLDAYDYQRYGTLTGTVSYVAEDSSAVEGRQGAYYVVRIDVDGDEVGRGELRGAVKLGMAGQVEVVTDRRSLLMVLLKKIRRTISLG
jgi:HlyD family type I secretion membrane fusion protein